MPLDAATSSFGVFNLTAIYADVKSANACRRLVQADRVS